MQRNRNMKKPANPWKSVHAVCLGRLGGKSKSPAKIEAAKLNGKKGGRPKKLTMKNPIEYDQKELHWHNLPPRYPMSTIHVCAWCEQINPVRIQVKSLKMMGYPISHGICEKHAAECLRKSRQN